MKLIVGLGNPGPEYEKTLHNVGFQVLDIFAEKLPLQSWKSSFNSHFISTSIEGKKTLLLKPQTYMNLSGQAVSRCLQYFKLSLNDVLVVFDDLDLKPGFLRYREGGGSGGHNGLKSIIQECGGANFHRLKIGIGHPGDKSKVSNYVLSSPKGDAAIALDLAIEKCPDYLNNFIHNQKIQISN